MHQISSASESSKPKQSIRAKRAFSADEKLQIFFVNNNTIASEHVLQFSYIQH